MILEYGASGAGGGAGLLAADRSRRLHLFLDAYRYDGDREAFAAAIVQRARRQASQAAALRAVFAAKNARPRSAA